MSGKKEKKSEVKTKNRPRTPPDFGPGLLVGPFVRFLLFLYPIGVLVALALSFVLVRYWRIRDWYYYTFKRSTASEHDNRVRGIQQQIKNYHKSGSKAKLCTARSNWKTMSLRYPTYKGRENSIHIELYDILELNEEARTVRVEPLCNIGRLTKYLSARGWTVAVVPELDDLTIGGMINGYGIESTSHRAGLFFDLVEECEVVLGDGSVIVARPDNEHRDFFNAISWSHGCLGFLVSVTLRIMPATKYVRVRYRPVHGRQAITDDLTELAESKKAPDFLECLMYDIDNGVIMEGTYTNERPTAPVNVLTRWYKPWFFKHVEDILNADKEVVEFIPLREYYHRHTRGLFWEMEMILPFGNNPLFRWPFGWMMPPSVQVIKMVQGRRLAQFFKDMLLAQDLLVPASQLLAGLEYNDQKFDIWPVWLCPHKVVRTDPPGFLNPEHPNKEGFEMYWDIGLYGIPKQVKNKRPFSQSAASWELGNWCRQRASYQALYAITEMNREEFEQMFDHTLFHSLRKKYHADAVFPEPYDKISSK